MNSLERHPEISIVIPVYNSAEILPLLIQRLCEVRKNLPFTEIIFVDDASQDDSWNILKSIQKSENDFKVLRLRKNAGVDSALLAGLRTARGETIVILDDDLQQAPEDIPKSIEKLNEGFDVLYGKYDKKRQSLWKNLGSWTHDKMARIVHGKPKDIHLSSFKILTRRIANEVIRYQFPYPYIDGLILRAASKVGFVPLVHYPRASGTGHHNFFRSSKIFFNSLTTFSFLPLRILLLIGILLVVGSFLYYLGTWFEFFPSNSSTSITLLFLFVGGIQLLGLGLLGEYLGRTYMGLGQKPQYLIDDFSV